MLLELARHALALAVRSGKSLTTFPDCVDLSRPAGAFVTLHQRGRLRGCIGQLASAEPLVSVVAYCAKAAATEDPRFSPLSEGELPEIEIELSILSPLEDISVEQIVVFSNCLLVSNYFQRGVIIPQVAVQFNWSAERFLEETCVKAGLERTAWKEPATRIQAFTAEIFSESDFRFKTN